MKNILIQAIHFIGLSGIGWILDFCSYSCLGIVSNDLAINNTISSWIGVTFVFIFATRRIFQNNSQIPLRWKYLLYLIYQIILIAFISRILVRLNTIIIENIDIEYILLIAPIIAKILVTPITMILNFFVMKSVIEKI